MRRQRHEGDPKRLPLLEDLRNHSPEQLAELRELLNSGAPLRPDARRSGLFEVDGDSHVFYICKYPSDTKVLLVAVWERDQVSEDADAGNTDRAELGERLCVDG